MSKTEIKGQVCLLPGNRETFEIIHYLIIAVSFAQESRSQRNPQMFELSEEFQNDGLDRHRFHSTASHKVKVGIEPWALVSQVKSIPRSHSDSTGVNAYHRLSIKREHFFAHVMIV